MLPIDPLHRLLSELACLLFALTLISCQTGPVPLKAVDAKPVPQAHWVKVSSKPPTFYPRGVPASCPTDHWSGEWVETGDEKGTRYFIPFRVLGVRRLQFVHAALSARSEQKLVEVAAEDQEIRLRNIRNMALWGPPTCAGIFVAAMGGGALGPIDLHHLQKSWDRAKEPHAP
jgi:hypothetical protein